MKKVVTFLADDKRGKALLTDMGFTSGNNQQIWDYKCGNAKANLGNFDVIRVLCTKEEYKRFQAAAIKSTNAQEFTGKNKRSFEENFKETNSNINFGHMMTGYHFVNGALVCPE